MLFNEATAEKEEFLPKSESMEFTSDSSTAELYQPAKVIETNLLSIEEDVTHPKMLSIRLKAAYHDVYCYGLAVKPVGNDRNLLLMAIISGSDSALQSVKAAIDIGSHDMMFGHGEKEDETDIHWTFKKQSFFFSEKGKYDTFPISISSNKKALIIVHEDVMSGNGYLLSFEKDPSTDIAHRFGGQGFGLPILPEWKEEFYKALLQKKYLSKFELYAEPRLFENGLHLFSLDVEEEQADQLLTSLIREGKIRFSEEGTGSKLQEIQTLPNYLGEFNQPLAKHLAKEIEPGHNPVKDNIADRLKTYPRALFPVQGHVATAAFKHLEKNKAIIIQGEMSTGKTTLMTSIADIVQFYQGKEGFHAVVTCPPSLTKNWRREIAFICPNAKVITVKNTKDLIEYHQDWVRNGRPKPKVPTFFIISFTTLRGDARIEAAAPFVQKGTVEQIQKENFYRFGHYCPSCGQPHMHVESREELDEDGIEKEIQVLTPMGRAEFGTARRINGNNQNAFCINKVQVGVDEDGNPIERICGESLWTKRVPTRYANYKEWNQHQERLIKGLEEGEHPAYIQSRQKSIPKKTGYPRRVAAIEYIRRKCAGFIDLSIVDEVHLLKGGNTAQGNSLGALVKASKKVIAGTGTLFGGKSMDVYYLMWRLFPHEMVKAGYRYSELTRFNEEFGNIEETTYVSRGSDESDRSNTNSRGGQESRTSKKVVPGISPYIYGRFMIHNVINVRLKDVWPNPVPFIDTPTIRVKPDKELQEMYDHMIARFNGAISQASRKEKGTLTLAMLDYGISMIDNPWSFPDAKVNEQLIWENPLRIDWNITTAKEKKLQDIVRQEMREKRASIVYVKDTGSTAEGRDVRPRLKHKLEEMGAKVCILDTNTTSTDNRSDWLEQKITKEKYDVCIVSQELVKVGLNLLCCPTLIYYQLGWSLFTLEQSKRRSWRIGQQKECRVFYIAYEDTFQIKLATLIAQKAAATAAINGDVTSDGLSAMLGEDDESLQTMLIKSIQDGDALEGSAEQWISETSDEALRLLEKINNPEPVLVRQEPVFEDIGKTEVASASSFKPAEKSEEQGEWENLLDMLVATEAEVNAKTDSKPKGKSKKSKVSDDQLAFDLFAM